MAGDAIVPDSSALSAFAERNKALRLAPEKELTDGLAAVASRTAF